MGVKRAERYLYIADDIVRAHVASVDICYVPLSTDHNSDGTGTPFTEVSKCHLVANTNSRCIDTKRGSHDSRVASVNMEVQQ